MGMTQLNETLLNSLPNIWIKKAYVQGFECKSITFKTAVKMFECMDIYESIHEVVEEPSYKKLLGQVPTVMVTAG